MPIKNRPHFPTIIHYDGLLIDCINNLYELVFGYPKHRDWTPFNENLPTKYTYGTVPVNKTHTLNIKPIWDADKSASLKNRHFSIWQTAKTQLFHFCQSEAIGGKAHRSKIKPCHCKG